MKIEVFTLNISENTSFDKFSDVMKLIDYKKRKRIKNYAREQDRVRGLVSDLLIRYIVMTKFKLRNKQLKFSKNKFGKPRLDNIPDFHYNISHSGEWIICAIHSKEIGIDIEKVKELEFTRLIKCFSVFERTFLGSKKPNDMMIDFFELWTLKESYIKILGTGLYTPLNSFTIQNNVGSENIELLGRNNKKLYFFKKYYLDSDYIISICAKNDEFPNTFINVDVDDFWNHINITLRKMDYIQ